MRGSIQDVQPVPLGVGRVNSAASLASHCAMNPGLLPLCMGKVTFGSLAYILRLKLPQFP
jgi:hypothetical protein